MIKLNLKNFSVSNSLPLILIVGPCVLENEKKSLDIAEQINKICKDAQINYVFKSSFDKANRSSIKSNRGINLNESLEIFSKIKKEFNCPIITDVHTEDQCKRLSDNDVIDVLQIPAFLCRQTDLLLSAAKTNKIINVKKGQFLAPNDVSNIFEKIQSENNNKIMITERGTSFGYNNLVNDFRGIDIMKQFKFPVIFDATHSVQQPGGQGESSGGQREFVEYLARAAVAVGVAGVFIETHQDPDNAPSDGPNMVPLNEVKALLKKLLEIDKVVK